MIRQAAIAHSKHRNMFGLVGVEISHRQKKVFVKLVRQWPREQINHIHNEISTLYNNVKWGETYIDQQTGQHFIQNLTNNNMNLRIITTQKNLKDPAQIEYVRIMDKIEMVQLMIVLKQNHQIVFPKNPTHTMKQLEEQIAIFSEHKTEAGSVDYFAPGQELDNLTKALMINCFAARTYLLDIEPDDIQGTVTDYLTDAEQYILEQNPSLQKLKNFQKRNTEDLIPELQKKRYKVNGYWIRESNY